MGKRTSGLTGVASLAFRAFNDAQPSQTPAPAPAPEQSTDSGPPVTNADSQRPKKRQKLSKPTVTPEEKYDGTGLVPWYTNAEQVPDHLQKYYSQRKRLFSLYDQGCLLDEEGWYSVTPERIADQIAERCRCDTVLDAFCGVGGNAIAFAKTCERVITLDTSPTRLALARHNATIYGVADRIEFILTDYIAFAHSYLSTSTHQRPRTIDVVFLSPPWGGPSYLSGGHSPKAIASASAEVAAHPEYSLSSIQPLHGAELFNLSRRITSNVAFYLPRNAKLEEISALIGDQGELTDEMIEVEEEWMGTKLKALTCYFGGLVAGQENSF